LTSAKAWFLRAMSLSRKGIVKRLQSTGVPEGWKKKPAAAQRVSVTTRRRVALEGRRQRMSGR